MNLTTFNRELSDKEKSALVDLLCHRCRDTTRIHIKSIIYNNNLGIIKKIIGSNFSNRLIFENNKLGTGCKFRYFPFQSDTIEIRCIRELLIIEEHKT